MTTTDVHPDHYHHPCHLHPFRCHPVLSSLIHTFSFWVGITAQHSIDFCFARKVGFPRPNRAGMGGGIPPDLECKWIWFGPNVYLLWKKNKTITALHCLGLVCSIRQPNRWYQVQGKKIGRKHHIFLSLSLLFFSFFFFSLFADFLSHQTEVLQKGN